MQPHELYTNTDVDKTTAREISLFVPEIQQHVKNVDGLSHLPEEFRKAHEIKRALTRRLRWQKLVRNLFYRH